MLIVRDKVYIIAEIGINHEGDVEKCRRMIDLAAESGADAVKLQTIDADLNYVQGTQSYKVFKKAELTRNETTAMFQYAQDIGVDIFTTCGDFPTAKWVNELNPVAWKVSSGLLTHIPMVRYLASFGRHMLISTGMATIDEIDQAVSVVEEQGNDITIFQCTSLYPAPPESLNLASMTFLKERYGHKVGFSDHSIGDDAAFLSVAAGATTIEKHFTFDSHRQGFDHGISLEPSNFKEMVKKVKLAKEMLGVVDKTIVKDVFNKRDKTLRVIVTNQYIRKGEGFTLENISIKRPIDGNNGIIPANFSKVIDCIATRDIKMNTTIVDSDFMINK